ncbi:hypothetical protein LWI28_009249 [Acer negundo]|uniref:BURP domain-containing protein n=1 Tax=Acer negundo TaxID=4023 RepID=A0AAD5NN12_ACENE|nr:hypothetical protein LWI28_009249 [Acer negundo]
MEGIMKDALNDCERAPSPGETKRCVASAEGMIDLPRQFLDVMWLALIFLREFCLAGPVVSCSVCRSLLAVTDLVAAARFQTTAAVSSDRHLDTVSFSTTATRSS